MLLNMVSNNLQLSIITSSFNSEKTISDTIDSILNQEVDQLEYIIVDGGSKDNTLEIIKQAESKFLEKGWKYKWISEKDSGIYNAWNKGLKLVSGDWVAFIGSDDVYNENALKSYLSEIKRNRESDFVTAKAKIKNDGVVIREFGSRFSWTEFRREMKILHAGGFLNLNYIKTYGEFDESFRITGDYEMLLRKGKDLKVTFIDEFLVEMDGGGVSNTMVYSSFSEAKRAKVITKSRSSILAMFDFYFVLLKIKIKKILSKG